MLIATHDGSFHADETIACAILTYIFDNTSIIRSRNKDELEQADLIIDVSGINDERHFDHHSKDFTLSRENGIGFATAGLMWHKFGREFLDKLCHNEKLNYTSNVKDRAQSRIDKEMMELIDLNDNGMLNTYLNQSIKPQGDEAERVFNSLNEFYQQDPSIPYIVAMQNPPSATAEQQHKAFLNTVKMLRQILINTALNALNIEEGIAKVLSLYDGGPILIMHEKLPWTSAVLSHPEAFCHCSLAVYPDRKRGFRVQSLPMSVAERFKNRVTAPESWCGHDEQELDQICGLNGTIFVHKSGFTGGALEFDTTMEMARLWLRDGRWDPSWKKQQEQQG